MVSPLLVSSVSIGDILSSDSSHYLVLEMMGNGGCGQIFKCRNMNTNDLVVLKLPTTHTSIFGTREEVCVCKTFSAFVSSLWSDYVIAFISIGEVSKEALLPQSPKHDQILGGFWVQGISMFSAWDFTHRSLRSGRQKWWQNTAE